MFIFTCLFCAFVIIINNSCFPSGRGFFPIARWDLTFLPIPLTRKILNYRVTFNFDPNDVFYKSLILRSELFLVSVILWEKNVLIWKKWEKILAYFRVMSLTWIRAISTIFYKLTEEIYFIVSKEIWRFLLLFCSIFFGVRILCPKPMKLYLHIVAG